MADHSSCIEELPKRAVRALTGVLSRSPQFGLGGPTDTWLRRQEDAISKLPSACRRPVSESLNPVAQLKRGLMKLSERHSVPWVPQAAILCHAHRKLDPWLIRSLFLLLASEVGIKSDRIRRFKGFDGQPPPQEVLDFVSRMTGISGLWIVKDDFEARFGSAGVHDMLPHSSSGCEACMLSVVGARAQLLIDLKANMQARRRSRHEPVLMRYVDSWIEWFGNDASALETEVSTLGHELRGIRREIGKRRHAKRKAARAQDKKIPYHTEKKAEMNTKGYPVPHKTKHKDGSSRGHTRHGSRAGATSRAGHRDDDNDDDDDGHHRYAIPGGAGPAHADPHDNMVSPVPAPENPFEPSDPVSPIEPTPDNDYAVEDGHEEGTIDWASEIGSYYFNDDHHPGARSQWNQGASQTRRTPSIHPAFRDNTNRASSNSPVSRSGRFVNEETLALLTGEHPSRRGGGSRQGNQADAASSVYTEVSLHTTGGRTDLRLAPQISRDEEFERLIRAGHEDQSRSSSYGGPRHDYESIAARGNPFVDHHEADAANNIGGSQQVSRAHQRQRGAPPIARVWNTSTWQEQEQNPAGGVARPNSRRPSGSHHRGERNGHHHGEQDVVGSDVTNLGGMVTRYHDETRTLGPGDSASVVDRSGHHKARKTGPGFARHLYRD